MDTFFSVIILTVLGVGAIFYFNLEKIITIFEFRRWKKQILGIHEYDSDTIRAHLNNIAKSGFSLYGDKLPYGRSKWFINGDQKLNKLGITEELEYYGFSPVRSMIELEFKEYGRILTQEGIFSSYQYTDENNNKKKSYLSKSDFYPFKGLWKLKHFSDKQIIKFYYIGGENKELKLQNDELNVVDLILSISNLVDTGYTNDLDDGYIKNKIKIDLEKYEKEITSMGSTPQTVGSLAAIYSNLGNHFHEIQSNSIVSAPMGHGHAAEYANDLIDKIKYPFSNVEQVGQNNAKNGADRIVGNQNIQTKYYANAKGTINAAFELKENGGQYRYLGMQLEVPKEQYNEAIELMKNKISDGKVPGHSDPKDAYNIIRKGNVTWTEAKLIAKGGNITSLKYDMLDGFVQTLPVAGISFIIVFSQALWSGAEKKDAALYAAKAATRTLVMGAFVYGGSQQFAKIMTAKIAEHASKKVLAETIAKRSGMAISFTIVIGPYIFDKLTKRISSQQLLKNTLVAGGGFAAGVGSSTLAGAALGSFAPGAGNLIGALVGASAGIIGGVAGSATCKKILDNFIKDDRVEMFAQLKEEYIDVVMSISLSESEFNEVQELIFDKFLESKLKDMFKNNQNGSRKYAREYLIETVVENIISKREHIYDEVIIESVENATNELVMLV
jgi:hypothetical protein